MPAKKEPEKVMDVAKPGKTAPAPTSKPVIVGHKSMIQDPMVSTKAPVEQTSTEDKITVTRGSKVIVPLGASEDKPPEEKKADEAKPEPKPETPTVVESKVEEPKPEQPEQEAAKSETPTPVEPEKQEEPSKPTEADESSDSSATDKDAGVVDAVAEQAGNKKKKEELTEAEKKKQEELEKLIEDKKYYVPVGQVTKKRRTRWTLVLLLFLVIVGAAVYAIDAELIDVGFKLPFDLIKV